MAPPVTAPPVTYPLSGRDFITLNNDGVVDDWEYDVMDAWIVDKGFPPLASSPAQLTEMAAKVCHLALTEGWQGIIAAEAAVADEGLATQAEVQALWSALMSVACDATISTASHV
jgi:hypothetical protein